MYFYSPRRIQFILQLLEKSESQRIATTRKRITTMLYKGSCHCGNIAIEVEGELTGGLACNCSICSRKGSLLWFVPRDSLKVSTKNEAGTGSYTFNKHVIKHRFCKTCGIHPYGEGVDPKGNRMAAINVRCLDAVDLDALKIMQFDGRAV
jgi:hypothetical protein